MTQFIERPIYHITGIGNLPSIIGEGALRCDTHRLAGKFEAENIGYNHIKERRQRRQVRVAAKGVLADYVPFYFCPRSVMLYTIQKGNVAECERKQEDIVHLRSTIKLAVGSGRKWAFTNRHAEPPEADYFDKAADLDKLNWEIIDSDTWGGDDRRPFKQAEFLVHGRFEWKWIDGIGVFDSTRRALVEAALASANHQPVVQVKRNWYY